MDTVASKKINTKEPSSVEVEGTPSLPSKRDILDTLYSHYGKPSNIMQEKVKLYFGYESPAGHRHPDWVVDGWQQGRVNVYVRDDGGDKRSLLGGSPKIPKEGVGTWFIGVKGNQIRVYVAGKAEATLEIGESNG
tara:strand:- start:1089 stop:1493 length:405 start_codon:yes stop_codon:yes gene_type:complete